MTTHLLQRPVVLLHALVQDAVLVASAVLGRHGVEVAREVRAVRPQRLDAIARAPLLALQLVERGLAVQELDDNLSDVRQPSGLANLVERRLELVALLLFLTQLWCAAQRSAAAGAGGGGGTDGDHAELRQCKTKEAATDLAQQHLGVNFAHEVQLLEVFLLVLVQLALSWWTVGRRAA